MTEHERTIRKITIKKLEATIEQLTFEITQLKVALAQHASKPHRLLRRTSYQYCPKGVLM